MTPQHIVKLIVGGAVFFLGFQLGLDLEAKFTMVTSSATPATA